MNCRIVRLLLPCLAACFLLAPQVWAQMAPGDSRSGSLFVDIVRAIFVLLVVLGLFFLFVYLLKRYFPRFAGLVATKGEEGTVVEVLDVRALSPKRHIYLLRVREREFLIGATDQEITSLGQWRRGKSEGRVTDEKRDIEN